MAASPPTQAQREQDATGGHSRGVNQVSGLWGKLAQAQAQLVGLCSCGSPPQESAEAQRQDSRTPQPLDSSRGRNRSNSGPKPPAQRVARLLSVRQSQSRVWQTAILREQQSATMAMAATPLHSRQVPALQQ